MTHPRETRLGNAADRNVLFCVLGFDWGCGGVGIFLFFSLHIVCPLCSYHQWSLRALCLKERLMSFFLWGRHESNCTFGLVDNWSGHGWSTGSSNWYDDENVGWCEDLFWLSPNPQAHMLCPPSFLSVWDSLFHFTKWHYFLWSSKSMGLLLFSVCPFVILYYDWIVLLECCVIQWSLCVFYACDKILMRFKKESLPVRWFLLIVLISSLHSRVWLSSIRNSWD